MLLIIPGSSLKWNSSLMLSCFLCATLFIWPLSPLTDWQLTVSVQRWFFSSSSVPQVPAAAVFFGVFFPNNWCLACQTLEIMWRGGSQHRFCKLRSQHLQMLPYVVLPASAHSSDQWALAHHGTTPEGTAPAQDAFVLIEQLEVLVNVASFDVCNFHLFKPWLSYWDYSESELNMRFFNLQITLWSYDDE